jgi:hypothetical protein
MEERMKLWSAILVLGLVAGVVVGCGGDSVSSVAASASPTHDLASSADDTGYTSTVLDTSYEGALPASSQLALGTFDLERTENAVTPEQARALLPLWQAIQRGSLQNDAETNAVLKQIEGAMTTGQLAAIAAMRLTFEDMGAWMQEQGVTFAPPEGAAEGQNSWPNGAAPSNMGDDERAAMRATAEAGGGLPGGGGFPGGSGNMSEEQRAALRATAEAGGMTFPGAGATGDQAAAGRGQLTLLAEQVVKLLTARAAE